MKIFFKTYLVFIHIVLAGALIAPEMVKKAYSKAGIIDRSLSSGEIYKKRIWEQFVNRSKTLDKNSTQMVFFGD